MHKPLDQSIRSRNSAPTLQANVATQPMTAVASRRAKPDRPGMRLIPWNDIWISLKVAKFRGNGNMIDVFYETLFKEAVFDDRGAWSLNIRLKNN